MAHCAAFNRQQRASTKSNASTASTASTTSRALCLFGGCFGVADPTEERLARLASQIQLGNTLGVERTLRKLRLPPPKVVLSVKRQNLNPNFVAWANRAQDPFLHFHQQSSPVLWAVDNQQWQMLPILARHGLDPNRPLVCRRWSFGSSAAGCSTAAPYRRFWTRGRYTYQSALDYYFGSIYEFLDKEVQRMSLSAVGYSAPSSFHCFFQQLPQLLACGVDVHRVDSVVLFNCLGHSLNWYLTKYTNENNSVPDIPEQWDACAEMFTVQSLIKAGFSQLECFEFLSSSHNWFGILICLLCHPRLDQYADSELPPIFQEAALLLINFLSLRSHHPTAEELRESLENLSLRKLYAKRYSQRRLEFNSNLGSLQAACLQFTAGPQSLRLQARNALRRKLGGVSFQQRLRRIANCPPDLLSFVAYIDLDSLHLLHVPEPLLKLAKRENPFPESAA